MTLKIKYLDGKSGSAKNIAIFLAKESKISDFKGIFDDKINKKILNFLKNNKNTKKNKITTLNLEIDQKLILILIANKNDQIQSEKLGAKFYDNIKANEVSDILILGSNSSSVKNNIILNSFIHGAELKSYQFNLYKSKKNNKIINFSILKSKNQLNTKIKYNLDAILNGVNFTFTKGYIESASTNGHRLAVASVINQNNDFLQESDINTDEEPLSITIPTRSLREIERLLTLKSNEKLLKIFYDKGQIIFYLNDQIITSCTLEGRFPPYKALLPNNFYKVFRFDRAELINALERIAVFKTAQQISSIVKISLENEDFLTFSSDAQDIGNANESLPLELVEGKYDQQFINTRPYLKSERVINNQGELYLALEDIEKGREEPFHKDLNDPEEIEKIELYNREW